MKTREQVVESDTPKIIPDKVYDLNSLIVIREKESISGISGILNIKETTLTSSIFLFERIKELPVTKNVGAINNTYSRDAQKREKHSRTSKKESTGSSKISTTEEEISLSFPRIRNVMKRERTKWELFALKKGIRKKEGNFLDRIRKREEKETPLDEKREGEVLKIKKGRGRNKGLLKKVFND